jgi:hypothetical protein
MVGVDIKIVTGNIKYKPDSPLYFLKMSCQTKGTLKV